MTWAARSLKTAPDLAINGRIEPTLISPRNAESSWHAITKIAKRLFGPGLTQTKIKKRNGWPVRELWNRVYQHKTPSLSSASASPSLGPFFYSRFRRLVQLGLRLMGIIHLQGNGNIGLEALLSA